jgi:hypothetical protein
MVINRISIFVCSVPERVILLLVSYGLQHNCTLQSICALHRLRVHVRFNVHYFELKHHDKLGNHSNTILQPLLVEQQRRRLRKLWPADLIDG